uniref:Uncharacterized protein n=1 Tax=Rhizophora mucronata TaxID=61149 RepID=A0A2P2QZR0_RHIMU
MLGFLPRSRKRVESLKTVTRKMITKYLDLDIYTRES